MILIKGRNVQFQMSDGKWISPSRRYGLIHDPDGTQLPRCFVYLGPYKTTSQRVPLTRDAEAYFGPDYQGTAAVVDVPRGPWEPLGDAVQIRYDRPGTRYRGKYYHFFNEKTVVQLSKCKNHFRIELQDGCIVNWRGFVYP
jgi:hypothetical protein